MKGPQSTFLFFFFNNTLLLAHFCEAATHSA